MLIIIYDDKQISFDGKLNIFINISLLHGNKYIATILK